MSTPRTDAITQRIFKHGPSLTTFRGQLQYQTEAARLYLMECMELETELAAAKAQIESLRDDAINKVMAASDDQIDALCRLDGRAPADVAKICKQGLEISLLKLQLAAANDKLAEIEKAAELPDALAYQRKYNLDTSRGVVPNTDYEVLRVHALHLAAENVRLRTAFRVNMLRLRPDFSHEDIERVISGEDIDAARKGKA